MPALRVLVVDDAPEVRHLVRAYLQAECELVICAEAYAAIEAFSANPPDVALVDLNLGEECGFELLSALRALPGGRTARIVAMSASATVRDRARTHRGGFDGHLAKPLSRDRVWRALAPAPEGSSDHLLADRTWSGEQPAVVARDPGLDDILPELLDSIAASTRRLDALVAAGARDEVRRIGHRIAGSGALLGFEPIGDLGRALEQAAIAGDVPTMARLAAVLCHDVERVLRDTRRRITHA